MNAWQIWFEQQANLLGMNLGPYPDDDREALAMTRFRAPPILAFRDGESDGIVLEAQLTMLLRYGRSPDGELREEMLQAVNKLARTIRMSYAAVAWNDRYGELFATVRIPAAELAYKAPAPDGRLYDLVLLQDTVKLLLAGELNKLLSKAFGSEEKD